MERQRVLPLLQVDPCSLHICHYNGSLTDELLVALLRPDPMADPGAEGGGGRWGGGRGGGGGGGGGRGGGQSPHSEYCTL